MKAVAISLSTISALLTMFSTMHPQSSFVWWIALIVLLIFVNVVWDTDAPPGLSNAVFAGATILSCMVGSTVWSLVKGANFEDTQFLLFCPILVILIGSAGCLAAFAR